MSVGGSTRPEPANPVGSGTAGHGRKQIELNVINAVGMYDQDSMVNQSADGISGLGVYQISDRTQLDIHKGDFLLTKRVRSETFAWTPDKYPRFSASLNGAGKEAKLQYPGDPGRQKRSLLAGLGFGGISQADIKFTSESRPTLSLSGKQTGNATSMALENMPFGSYVKLDAPDPGDPDLASRPHVPGEHPGTVKMEPTVYVPKTISATVAQNFRDFLEDEKEEPEDAFDEELHEMDPYRYYYDMKTKSSIVEGLLFVRRLTRHGFRLQINDDIRPELDVREDAAAPIGQTDILLGLAKAFGYLGNVAVPSVFISRENQKAFLELRKAFMTDVLYDGGTDKNAFHYEEGTPFTWSEDLEHSDDPGHRMTHLQINQFPDILLAMVDALEEERRWIVGRVHKSAEPGDSFHMIMRT